MTVAIYFDLSGVLFSNGSHSLVRELVERHGIERAALDAILFGKDSWGLRRGEIDARTFWSRQSPRIDGLCLPAGFDLRLAWLRAFTPMPGMLELLARLAARHRLGIIAESTFERVADLDARFDFRRHFVTEHYSFERHADKRDGGLFRIALGESGTALVVEDDPASAATAASLGMPVILFGDAPALTRELAGRGFAS